MHERRASSARTHAARVRCMYMSTRVLGTRDARDRSRVLTKKRTPRTVARGGVSAHAARKNKTRITHSLDHWTWQTFDKFCF